MELESIELASVDNEQRFLAENKAYLLSFREHQHRMRLQSTKSYLDIQRSQVETWINNGKALTGANAAAHAKMAEEQTELFNQRKRETVQSTRDILAELERELETSTDNEVRAMLQTMISASKEALVNLEHVNAPTSP